MAKRTQIVLGYTRVSTDQQAEQGHSLAQQEAAIRAYCVMKGLELAEIIVDDGYSGGTLDRPGLTKMRALIAKRKVSHVVVLKMDRLTRDIRSCITDELALAKVTLVSTTEAIDVATFSGQSHALMLQFFATLERMAIADRTKTALRHMKSEGKRTGAVPYGFAVADDGVHLVEIATEVETIRRARALRTTGISLRAVSASLAAEGRCARSGKPFSACQTQNMLDNERVAA